MLAREVRSGLVEADHQGALAVFDVDGSPLMLLGDVDRPLFFRSALKPFQAAVCQKEGAALGLEELAVAAGSHAGQPVHVAYVERMLAGAGLTEHHLQCPAAWPGAPSAANRLVAEGVRRPRRIYHNCSGKHAAMLRAAAARGWPLESYRSPDHPLQVEIAGLVAGLTGEAVTPVGVDGCGVPTLRGSVRGLARAFARLGTDERFEEVRTAMHRYPALTADGNRAEAAIATWVNGLAKVGARGALGVSIFGRLGAAARSWDGLTIAASVGMIAALTRLGALPPVAVTALAPHAAPTVTGGGAPVGSLEPALPDTP